MTARYIPHLVDDLHGLADEFGQAVTEMMTQFVSYPDPRLLIPEEVSRQSVADMKASLSRLIDAAEHFAQMIRTREGFCSLSDRTRAALTLAHVRRAMVANVPQLDPSANSALRRRRQR